MMSEENIPINHHLTIANISVFVLPVIVFVVVYSLYIGLRHSVSTFFFIPSPSDLISLQPEYRIYSVSMTIESFLMLFVCYVQNKIRSILANKNHKKDTRKYRILKALVNVSMGLFAIGNQILAIVSYNSYKIINAIGANLYGYGGLIYFLACDVFNAYVGKSSSIPSRILSWIVTATTLLQLIIRYYAFTRDDDASTIQWWTMSSIFFILESLCGYLKMYLLSRDLPKVVIRMSKKIM